MKTVEVSTVVRVPPEEAYEFLTDFEGYAKYSKHLERVDRDGDGGPGTTYRLRFAWWKLGYTAQSRVTGTDPPREIRWEVTKDLDARGAWEVEPLEDGETCRVTLVIHYDPDSAHSGMVDLPAFVSLGWVVGKVMDVIVREGERVVERMVADLEGERRPVDLRVRESDRADGHSSSSP